MEITLNELLQGNATLIKGKEYLSAKEYVQPFLDVMDQYTSDYRIHVKLADQISIGDTKNIIYNRVLVEAILPEEQCIEKHDEVIGFLYGLDIRKPIAKIYRGYVNQACTNLAVFSPEWIKYQEVIPEKELDYSITDLMEKTSDFKSKICAMKQKFIPNEDRLKLLGEWIDFSLHQFNHNGIHSTKISPNSVIDAYKSLYLNIDSPYFTDIEVEESSLFNAYNAFTQTLTDDKKDIMNTFEKTLLINQMLKV